MNDMEAIRRLIALYAQLLYAQLLDAKRLDEWVREIGKLQPVPSA